MADKLSQRVYDWVCGQLLSGALRGGDKVSELALAKATGVSRSPVREALVRLRAEGLLEHVPKLGASVRIPSRAEMDELYTTREWLEGGAAASLAGQHEADTLVQLQGFVDETLELARSFYQRRALELDEEGSRRMTALDTEFHLALVQACANRVGLETLARTHLLIAVGGYRVRRFTAEVVTRIYTDHDGIVRAIRRGDEAGAWGAMVAHVRWSAATAREQLAPETIPEGAPTAAWPEPMRTLLERLR